MGRNSLVVAKAVMLFFFTSHLILFATFLKFFFYEISSFFEDKHCLLPQLTTPNLIIFFALIDYYL